MPADLGHIRESKNPMGPALNLLLAVVWLVVAGVCFAISWSDPKGRALGITDFSVGWVALILCAYNLLRWWAERSSAANRRSLREVSARRRSRDAENQAGTKPTPDPNFDFTDRPAP
jgi:hypothetical protein